MITSIHLMAALIELMSRATNVSVVSIPVVWEFQLKQLLLTIDAVLILALGFEGLRDIRRIYKDARTSHEQL